MAHAQHAALQEAIACPSCDATMTGAFCAACGETRPDAHDFSWSHAVHDAVHEFVHLDGKIIQTLWLLIRRPGFLTAEYWQGRKRLHIRPLRLYIVLAAVHLIALSASFYRVEMFLDNSSAGPLRRMIEGMAERQHMPVEAVRTEINHYMAKIYSVGQYFAVLCFAAVPWLLYRRRKPHYLQHVIFSLHIYAFYFLLTAIVSQFLSPQQWQRSPMPLVTLAYMYFAVRRLYEERPVVALGKAVALRLGLFAAEFIALGIALTGALFWLKRH